MIEIKQPTTKDEFKEYYALRYHVLREPWGQPKGTEKDDFEPLSQHFMAVDDETGHVVGVVKLFEKAPGVASMSHLAIAKNCQRRGVGTLLMKHVEQIAREEGYKALGGLTRVTATAFFEKFGYHITGLPSLHFGTVHMVWMEKKLE